MPDTRILNEWEVKLLLEVFLFFFLSLKFWKQFPFFFITIRKKVEHFKKMFICFISSFCFHISSYKWKQNNYKGSEKRRKEIVVVLWYSSLSYLKSSITYTPFINKFLGISRRCISLKILLGFVLYIQKKQYHLELIITGWKKKSKCLNIPYNSNQIRISRGLIILKL